ncbi:hypothetical protein [Bradyrhizobium sp. DOA9]|uniref:hypothetical protein n=1 Tax=Bradyrhizobium sp. DOA9 TaxID=1126627 RepID=UPI00072366D6|nr:hypothetical protein [Bradyrhizobium sp. DOA9]GAJ33668.1 hypothetical protein BDOA9_0128660 [Bradyrhizobium sp. DOA9]
MELSTTELDSVSGGGLGFFGQLFVPTILKTSTVNPAPTGPVGPSNPSTGGGHKSASFDPVGVRF